MAKLLYGRDYNSIQDACRAILASKGPDGEWLVLNDDDNASLERVSTWAGPVLGESVKIAQTLQGPGLTDAIRHIDSLTDSLAGDVIPPGVSFRRQRQWGKRGYAVNIHRVNRGQLSRAWRRTVRQRQLGNQGVITLCVNVVWSAGASHDLIHWTTAANLALAAYIEASGRRCELWAVAYNRLLYTSKSGPAGHGVRLKAASEPWNTQNVALTCEPFFLRRLMFRLYEIQTPEYGNVRGGYGKVSVGDELLTACQRWASERLQAPAETVLCGGDQSNHIDNEESAKQWLRAKINELDHQEEKSA